MINKKLNIAIIGLGNIGSYLYKYLKTNKEILSKNRKPIQGKDNPVVILCHINGY